MTSFDTPAGKLARNGKRMTFGEVGIGRRFELNGNIWVKRTSRTASGRWPSILPEWSYVKKNEVVNVDMNG